MSFPARPGSLEWLLDPYVDTRTEAAAPGTAPEAGLVPDANGPAGAWAAPVPGPAPPADDAARASSSRARRFGKTCGECRRQHLRCDYSLREEAAASHAAQAGVASAPVRCTRCEHRGVECVQVSVSMTRYYPRPSRTGRRIELGRQLHGSAVYPEADAAGSEHALPSDAGQRAQRELSWPRIYLRMIKVFFSYTHTHFPLVVYERFAHAFNLAYGDFRLMAQYMNGGEAERDHPVVYTGPQYAELHKGAAEQECTPETMEVLMAVILTWAARHVHLPFESLDPSIFTHMGTTSLVDAILADPELGFKRTPPAVEARGADAGDAEGVPRRRVKRRQGVACDTCRLRRVRCDLMEQPPGSKACSRCRVKRIVCTDRYIQWKQQRDLQKRPAGGTGDTRTLPVAVASVQLLPELYEFEFDELLAPATLNLSQQELLECGMVREGVCNMLLNRALLLVHKYDLQHMCNAQSAQCLMLLASLLDYARPEMALNAQRASVRHLAALWTHVQIDLTHVADPGGAPECMRLLLASRAQMSAYVRDAIFNVSYLRRPQFAEDWFLLGMREPGAPGDAAERGLLRPLRVSELERYLHEDLSPPSAQVLVFCSTIHLGKLSHRMYRELIEPLAAQSALPTHAEVCRVADVVHALWDDLYIVEHAHQVLAGRARGCLCEMRAVSVVHWAMMLYILLFIVYQAVSRRLRDWYVTSNSQLARGAASDEERTRILDALRMLLEESQERTLCICRVVAHLTRNQLESGLLHRASSLTRQLFRVTQFLARTQPVESAAPRAGGAHERHDDGSPATRVDFLLNPTSAAPSAPSAMPPDPPHALRPEDTKPDANVARARVSIFDPEPCLAMPTTRTLAPFSREAKRDEIDWCIEGLGQVGYAFAGLETEIRRIVDIVQAMS